MGAAPWDDERMLHGNVAQYTEFEGKPATDGLA
jgi:hypothetical protein